LLVAKLRFFENWVVDAQTPRGVHRFSNKLQAIGSKLAATILSFGTRVTQKQFDPGKQKYQQQPSNSSATRAYTSFLRLPNFTGIYIGGWGIRLPFLGGNKIIGESRQLCKQPLRSKDSRVHGETPLNHQ
jgi:hypothetical protein